MYPLIIAVIAVSLGSVVALGGFNYISLNLAERKSIEMRAGQGFSIIENMFSSYVMANQIYPSDPLNPNDTTWINQLEDFGKIPKPPENTSWKYGVDGDDRWLCVQANNATEIYWKAFDKVRDNFGNDTVSIYSTCFPGAGDTELTTPPASFPANLGLVYTIK